MRARAEAAVASIPERQDAVCQRPERGSARPPGDRYRSPQKRPLGQNIILQHGGGILEEFTRETPLAKTQEASVSSFHAPFQEGRRKSARLRHAGFDTFPTTTQPPPTRPRGGAFSVGGKSEYGLNRAAVALAAPCRRPSAFRLLRHTCAANGRLASVLL